MELIYREVKQNDIQILNEWHKKLKQKENAKDVLAKYLVPDGCLFGDLVRCFALSDNEKIKPLLYGIVAEVKQEIVGVLLYSINEKEKSAIIEVVAVNPEMYGRGTGKNMIENFILFKDEILPLNVEKFVAFVAKQNNPSKKIFESNGFKKYKENSSYLAYTLNFKKQTKQKDFER